MILSDIDIRSLLGIMEFETDDHQHPFSPNDQIQPASIDLRLDRCFWIPRRSFRKSIGLISPSIGEMEHQRLYQRRSLRLAETIKLRPGELVLGRTFERFTIPNGYAGKIEGRSTFARLGLSIHCTGDFINPGWRGRMPLQLINHGKIPILLPPYVDICQLVIIKTTTASDKAYGANNTTSKYMNEEGEPSKYWLDVRLKKLKEACGKINLPENITKEFVRILGKKDVLILDRFTEFLDRQPVGEMTNAGDIIHRFSNSERRTKARITRRHVFFKWIGVALIGTAVGLLFKQPYGRLHYILWVVTIILSVPGFYYMLFAEPPGEYYTRTDSES